MVLAWYTAADMIIGHGPFGYLAARVTQRWWNGEGFSSKQRCYVYLATIVGAMIPDIDLLYIYFIDAGASHRQLYTHSIVIYLSLVVILFIAAWLTKKRFFVILILLFFAGTITHVLADMIIGLTVLFAPFSDNLYGFSSISWYRNSVFMQYSQVTGLGGELFVILLAIYTY